ncbi:condensation domain-containing protein [Croceitalea marina]|uniref:Condensation domain-containing protein n=1 Tax=Croceitalea marina TaxID=1775166 RepID=A0ABW5MS36_9FLAO
MIKLKSLIQSRFNVNLNIKDFYDYKSIQSLTEVIRSKEKADNHKIPPVDKSVKGYEISREQYRIWLASQTVGGSISHNMVLDFQLNGDFDVTLLKTAVKKTISRHEILRTYFLLNANGMVLQYLRETVDIEKVITVEKAQAENVESLLSESHNIHFRLEECPLFHILIIQKKVNQYIFSLVIHHIIGDMVSLDLFFKEILLRYNALSQRKKLYLPALNIQYKDYAKWINDNLKSSYFDEQREFWQQYLNGIGDDSKWYTYHGQSTFEGKTLTDSFDPELTDKIKSYCQQNNQRLMSFMATALGILIYKKTHQRDILIGIPSSLRQHPDLMEQMGLYLNVLPFRVTIEKDQTLSELLIRNSQNQIQILQASLFPFDKIIERFEKNHQFNLASRIDIFLNVLINDSTYLDIAKDLAIKPLETNNKKSKFPLCVYIQQFDEKLIYMIEYQTAVFTENEIKNFEKRLLKTITQMIDFPNKYINDIELIEKDALPLFQM